MVGVTSIFKRTPDVTNLLANVMKGEKFQNSLKEAGSIAGLIGIGIDMYKQIKDELKTDEERAFGSLIQIVFESAKESLPPDSIKKTIANANTNDIKQELFNTFIKPEEGWNSYLPDHPVIVQFRSHICNILRNEQLNNQVRDFVFSFNLRLEDKADITPAIEPFKKRATLIERNKNLIKHLEYSRSLVYKVNPVDQRCIEEYYVENDSILDEFRNWKEEEKELPSENRSNVNHLIDKFLIGDNWLTIVGAPFGIGKTSLSIKLASRFASKYLDNPDDDYDYIPIFAPLKGELKNIDESQHSLSEIIKLIAPGEEGKKRKILLICDGLDEYGDAAALLEWLQNKHEVELPNLKVIITTRLNGELLEIISRFGSQYIRLLPFGIDQADQFFKKYRSSSIAYENLSTHLRQEETSRTPLFCWMFAIMMSTKAQSELILKDVSDPNIKKSLIYQRFIHSIIRGKHKDIAEKYRWTQYYTEEKNILRKIAALIHMHNGKLTRSMVIEGLKNYGIKYNENMVHDVLMPILTSYFYLDSTSPLDMSVDFIHKSFGEYLLAEYYIDSIFEDKIHYLSVGVPTSETLKFLTGLLELLKNEKKDDNNSVNFINSFAFSQGNDRRSLLTNFIKNAQRFFEEEQIIYQTGKSQQDGIWELTRFPTFRYNELSIHRWLTHYVLNILDEAKSNNELFVKLIQMTSHTIPPSLKRMAKANLSNADLALTNLSYADLSETNLSYAKLSGANLSGANLTLANLPNANLSNANLLNSRLQGANLSNANLSNADLSNSDLFRANLSRTNLSDANLSGAILTYANLSEANLSDANFSNANLSKANVSEANLSDAITRNARLPT
jgi:hypothetical protein